MSGILFSKFGLKDRYRNKFWTSVARNGQVCLSGRKWDSEFGDATACEGVGTGDGNECK